MAIRRIRAQRTWWPLPTRYWVPAAGGLGLVCIIWVCLLTGGNKQTPPEEPPPSAVEEEAAPAAEETDAPEVSFGAVDDEPVATPPADDAAAEPSAEPTPPPSEPADTPEDVSPEPAEGDTPPAETDTPTPEPGDDAPEPADEPQPAAEDEPEDDTPEPEPIAAEEEDTTPEPQPTDPEQIPEELLAYAADKSITGSALPMQKEWLELFSRAVSKKELGLFLRATEMRINLAVREIFLGSRLNYTVYRNSPLLQQAIEFCYMARGMGEEELGRLLYTPALVEVDARTSAEQFMVWALTDKARPLHQLILTFVRNSGSPIQMRYTMPLLYSLWKDTKPQLRTKYLNLMLACSLVHEMLATSPGLIRQPKDPLLKMPQLYKYYCKEDASGSSLLADVKKLSPTQLLYVVDVRLPASEFEWVNHEIKVQRAAWGSLYQSIEYMMERATQDDDPYTAYTFEEIKELGGVCRDQAYYTAYSAKCKGIPAVCITGDGARGPHAWVGLMTSDKGWSLAGSYGYSTGQFVNPCSGKLQHQSSLPRADKKMNEAKQDTAVGVMLLSAYMLQVNRPTEAMAAASYVCYTFPTFTAGWENRFDVMRELHETKPLEKGAWRRFLADLERFFSKNKELVDIAQRVEADYLMEGARDATKRSTLKRSTRKLSRLVGDSRADLMVESLNRQAQVYADAKDWHGLAFFYRQILREYAAKGRGDIVEQLLRQYASYIESAENSKMLWRTLAKDAEAAYGKRAYSGDYFKVKRDVEVMNFIADAYRRAGDSRKAEKIELDASNHLKQSQDIAEQNSANNNKKRK